MDGTVKERVERVIKSQFGEKAELKPEANLYDDLGGDSLDHVEVIFALEEEFAIEVPDEDAEKLMTVGDIEKYVEEKIKPKG